MKRKLMLLAFLTIKAVLFSQTIKTEVEIKEYFLQNMLILDPIEGIWGIDKCFWTAYYKNKSLGTQESTEMIGSKIAIIKTGNEFIIYKKSDNYISTEEYYESKGMPGQYFCHQMFYDIAHTSNAEMDDLFSLYNQVKMDFRANNQNEMFIAMAKQKNENTTNSFDMEMYFKYSKLFPTFSDYESANTTKTEQKKSTGTGFAISANGYIVTNYHVVKDAEKLSVRGINRDFSKIYNANVVIIDKNNDLAIIKIDDPLFTSLGIIPYSIKGTTSEVGENINVLGYPLTGTMGEEIKFTNGIISSKSGFQGDITCYQCSAPIQAGNSGGPMFDKDGNIIGIINAKHLNAENVSYAIKSGYLLNLIQSLPNPPNASINTLAGKKLTEQIKLIGKFVFIIEVN